MDKILKIKRSSDMTTATSTNDTSNDEIWEIIDKEDDGNNTLVLFTISLNLYLKQIIICRRFKKFISWSLCVYTIGYWHTFMVAYDRSATSSTSILADFTTRQHGRNY